jgi:hypothetical protein
VIVGSHDSREEGLLLAQSQNSGYFSGELKPELDFSGLGSVKQARIGRMGTA